MSCLTCLHARVLCYCCCLQFQNIPIASTAGTVMPPVRVGTSLIIDDFGIAPSKNVSVLLTCPLHHGVLYNAWFYRAQADSVSYLECIARLSFAGLMLSHHSPVPPGTFRSVGPIEKMLCFCDFCVREKDWCSRARGAKATRALSTACSVRHAS